MDDIIEEALAYAADLTYAMPVEGLVLEGGPTPGRVVEPDLSLVWQALTQQHRTETALATMREALLKIASMMSSAALAETGYLEMQAIARNALRETTPSAV